MLSALPWSATIKPVRERGTRKIVLDGGHLERHAQKLGKDFFSSGGAGSLTVLEARNA